MKLTEENYVGIAEQAIKELCSEKDQKGRLVGPVTTSKIRNSQSDKLNAEIIGRINYMKIRFIYEAGREPKVKKLVDKAKILEHLEEIKGSRDQYILFSRYMEALVAYRKFYGGRDE